MHGLVQSMRFLKGGAVFSHYQCVIVPRVWFLGRNRNHRIFQHKSVKEIISRILEEQGFAPETFAFKCFYRYEAREYCVQYGESDLYFISRLCEEDITTSSTRKRGTVCAFPTCRAGRTSPAGRTCFTSSARA